jgi:hypothetical protein
MQSLIQLLFWSLNASQHFSIQTARAVLHCPLIKGNQLDVTTKRRMN